MFIALKNSIKLFVCFFFKLRARVLRRNTKQVETFVAVNINMLRHLETNKEITLMNF